MAQRNKVLIIGRPNVGKSTLLNRLCGNRKAIVQREAGTTRDFMKSPVEWCGRELIFMDSAGIDGDPNEEIRLRQRNILSQLTSDADAIALVVDGQIGIHPQDVDVANQIRKSGKPILVVVNKLDHSQKNSADNEFHELGFKQLIGISALHGLAIGELLDQLVEMLPDIEIKKEEECEAARIPRVVIIGEPNVGKSTFMNQVLGTERVLISAEAGTTRDCIEEPLIFAGRTLLLMDTAGYRNAKSVRKAVDYFSTLRMSRAIEDADILLLFVAADQFLSRATKKLHEFIGHEKKPAVLVVNKWDLSIHSPTVFRKQILQTFPLFVNLPMTRISAMEGKNVGSPIKKALQLYDAMRKHIPIKDLNEALAEAVIKRPPAPGVRLKYLTKAMNRPEFILFCRRENRVTKNYRAFLENFLRRRFGMEGMPVHLRVREEEKS